MKGLFALLLLWQSPGASPECEQKARQLLPILAFARERDYNVLMCSENIEHLTQRFVQSDLPLPNARVLHIRHKAVPYMSLNPQRARLRVREFVYKPPHWMFHAILVVDGMVVDLDYRDEAHIVGINTYMHEMWTSEEVPDFLFQEKPASEEGGYDRSGLLNEDKYPTQNYADWVSKNQGTCADMPDLPL